MHKTLSIKTKKFNPKKYNISCPRNLEYPMMQRNLFILDFYTVPASDDIIPIIIYASKAYSQHSSYTSSKKLKTHGFPNIPDPHLHSVSFYSVRLHSVRKI